MFLHTLDDRAVSRLTLGISSRLAAAGIRVVVVCATKRADATVGSDHGIVIESLETGRHGTSFGILRLARKLRQEPFDVLFAHGSGPSRTAILARVLSRRNVRIITVEHTHYPTFEQHHGPVRDVANAALYRLADRVTGVSPGVVDDLEHRIPGVRGKTAVLPSIAPDAADLRRASLTPPEHPWFSAPRDFRVVCGVGNLVPRKGQDVLIRALPLIRRELGDIRLLLIGRLDDDAFVSRLRAMASELGVSDYVSIAGYLPDPLPVVSRADVFASASRTEGFGMAMVEAMAGGIPVVATDCPVGPRYILEAGRNGMLVPMDDPVSLAQAVVAVVSDPTLRARVVTSARARAAEFSAQEVARRYLALAQECLDEGGDSHVAA